MACHPDLVLRSKTSTYVKDINDEAVCRLCNDAVGLSFSDRVLDAETGVVLGRRRPRISLQACFRPRVHQAISRSSAESWS